VSAPHWTEEETHDPIRADARNFFKVEEWTADDLAGQIGARSLLGTKLTCQW
jgi:hypothetical protein